MRAHYKAHRASVAMSRRALQQIALEKGATPTDKLVTQIDWLAKSDIVTEQLRKDAHVVRALGNEGAHPGNDDLDDLGEDDAEDALDFLSEVIDYVYVLPHRVAEQERRIVERKGRGRSRRLKRRLCLRGVAIGVAARRLSRERAWSELLRRAAPQLSDCARFR